MSNLMDSVAGYLEHEGWEITRHDDEHKIRMGVSSEHGRWPCVISIDDENRLVFFHSVCPLKIPAEKRVKLAEFLMRVNRLCYIGHFVLDFDSGETRFETYAYGTTATVDEEEMESTVGRNLAMMDKHLGSISKVISSDITPAEAVAELITGVPMDRRYLYN